MTTPTDQGPTRCDFCSDRTVRWSYPAPDFELEYRGLRPGHGSRGNWAACQVCHELMQRDDRDGLAKRSLQLMAHNAVGAEERALARQARRDPRLAAQVLDLIRETQRQFFAHRRGTPLPV